MNTNSDSTPQDNSTATYCPEDNKLRLYVGWLPRDEYEKLRAEGWTSTPKQACDFVATWTPTRRDTALECAGIILDEDQSPEERAADRAERFGGYRDKRTGEAVGKADQYDNGPSVHGYQSQTRAERAARRHDKQAALACDAWSKAEYWTRRTAGVISHALHKSRPDVRMGRIKELEADLRRYHANKNTEWIRHLELRLAYENQMLEAQGGRAAHVEMEVGGFIGSKQIQKVCKSNVTGRVVSVFVKGTRSGYTKESGYTNYATVPCLVKIETERLPADAYRPPTTEERAAFLAQQKENKAVNKAKRDAAPKCPLVNPTNEEAEKLQIILNERAKAKHCERHMKNYGKDYADEFKPSTVCYITQAVYSANSKGAYARAETRSLHAGAELSDRETNMYNSEQEKRRERIGPALCEIRQTGSDGSSYGARRVIVLTDKPQKDLPAAVWHPKLEEVAK